MLHSASARRRVLGLFLVACGVPAALVRGQVPGGVDPTPAGFDLNVGLGTRYTTDPGLASGDPGADGDSITDLRADLIGHRRSPRTDWSVRYSPFYTRYRSNSQFDNLNHALNLDGRYVVTRLSRLSLLERFFYSQDLLQIDTAESAGEATILTSQANRWRNFTDAAFDASLSRSLTLQVGASTRIERFELEPLVNSEMYTGRLGIKKQVGREGSISSTYSYSRFDFQGDGLGAAEAQGMDLSWAHGSAERTEWALSAGVSKVSQGRDRENRLTASASLHHPFRRYDFVSSFRRSLGADSGVANVTVVQDAHAGISRRIGERSSLTVRGEYGTRDSVLESGDRLALDYAGGAVRAAIQLNPRLSIAGEARRRRQDVTEGAGEDLTVDTFFLRLDIRVF